MYHQFNIQQLYVLPTQCIFVFLYGSQNKHRLFPYTALTDWFYMTQTVYVYCAVRNVSLHMRMLIPVCQKQCATHFPLLLHKQIASVSKRFPYNSHSRPLTITLLSLSLSLSLSLPPPSLSLSPSPSRTVTAFCYSGGRCEYNITAKPLFVTITSRNFG